MKIELSDTAVLVVLTALDIGKILVPDMEGKMLSQLIINDIKAQYENNLALEAKQKDLSA